jgi:hypothetical protein
MLISGSPPFVPIYEVPFIAVRYGNKSEYPDHFLWECLISTFNNVCEMLCVIREKMHLWTYVNQDEIRELSTTFGENPP